MDVQIVGKTLYLDVSVRMFPKILAFGQVDCVKKLPSPTWVGIIQTVEGLSRTNSQRKGEFTLSV